MNIEAAQSWILVISSSITMLSITVGIWRSLNEYRLKLRAERRSEKSASIEAEMRLHKLFLELMETANARSGYQVSDSMIQSLSENYQWPLDEQARLKLHQNIKDLAVVTLPVGSAQQNSAIAAISSLATRHPELSEAGLCALSSVNMEQLSPFAAHYYEKTRKQLKDKGISPPELNGL